MSIDGNVNSPTDMGMNVVMTLEVYKTVTIKSIIGQDHYDDLYNWRVDKDHV